MKENFIYCLLDPRDDKVCYVGKTSVGVKRPLMHLTKSHSDKVNDWVSKIRSLKLEPKISIIEYTSHQQLENKERFWINHFKRINPDLLNIQIYTTNRIYEKEDQEEFDLLVKCFNDVARILKEKRLACNLSQKELSDRAGISRSTLSLLERSVSGTLASAQKVLESLDGFDKQINVTINERASKNIS